MSSTTKVRDACWQATHDFGELRDALEATVSSYKPKPGMAEERTEVLKDILDENDITLSDMRAMNGVLMDPPLREIRWYSPISWAVFAADALQLAGPISRVSLDRLSSVSKLSQYAMQGLEQGVHEFADLLASGYHNGHSRDFNVKDKLKMDADTLMEHALNSYPTIGSLVRVYCAKSMAEKAMAPMAKYIQQHKEEMSRISSSDPFEYAFDLMCKRNR